MSGNEARRRMALWVAIAILTGALAALLLVFSFPGAFGLEFATDCAERICV